MTLDGSLFFSMQIPLNLLLKSSILSSTMKLSLASLALLAASASAFTAVTPAGRASTSLNILAGTQSATERVANVMAARPEENEAIDALVKKNFPGAISNKAMETKIASILEAKGFTPANTLLCTSLCW